MLLTYPILTLSFNSQCFTSLDGVRVPNCAITMHYYMYLVEQRDKVQSLCTVAPNKSPDSFHLQRKTAVLRSDLSKHH